METQLMDMHCELHLDTHIEILVIVHTQLEPYPVAMPFHLIKICTFPSLGHKPHLSPNNASNKFITRNPRSFYHHNTFVTQNPQSFYHHNTDKMLANYERIVFLQMI
jgi:hypothetical protein